ncbi:MAG TPA: adenylyltransferase/cytidyltransferase family protein, partial [Phycisphaerales bacterium]|nr:adenylyltransferase/cytidyltransferase family protein [Phycisphaerales bacterium]
MVLCHGCFDIVHPGHVRHLQQAARLGDRLLVTVTGDTLVAKGTGRPLIPQELRAENLAELSCVSWVAINPSPNAADLLDRIRPNVYVKGAEYQHNNDPRFLLEKQIVERNGGRVVFTSGDIVFSSTALIAALEDSVNPFHSQLSRLIADLEVTPESIDLLLDSFAGQRILVIGETIKDTYVMCDRPAVAGEGPIMTLRPVEYRSFDGGAAIIARHLASLGARPVLLTGLKPSTEADALVQRLAIQGVEVHCVDTSNPVFEKQRYLVGSQKVMKLDLGQPQTLAASTQQRLVMLARRLAQDTHATIIADFGLGFFNSATLGALCEAVRPVTPVLT